MSDERVIIATLVKHSECHQPKLPPPPLLWNFLSCTPILTEPFPITFLHSLHYNKTNDNNDNNNNNSNDNNNKIAVINTDHTNKGNLFIVINGVRIFIIVVIKFIAPRIDEIPAKCKLKIAKSTDAPEWNAIEDNGG